MISLNTGYNRTCTKIHTNNFSSIAPDMCMSNTNSNTTITHGMQKIAKSNVVNLSFIITD